jgi:hypothetical protein
MRAQRINLVPAKKQRHAPTVHQAGKSPAVAHGHIKDMDKASMPKSGKIHSTFGGQEMTELQKKIEFQRQLRLLILFSTPEDRKGLGKYVRPVEKSRSCGIERVGQVLPAVMNNIYRRVDSRVEKCRV